MRRARWSAVLALGLLVSLAGCGTTIRDEPPPSPAGEEILADCFITFHLSAYEDVDGDGVRDSGEGDLAGIEFILNGTYAHSVAGGRAVTGQEGRATIDTWSPGECQDFSTTFSIDVIPPAGYRPSSAFPFEVHSDQASQDYEFGFQPGNGSED